jgi:hypothetical protein
MSADKIEIPLSKKKLIILVAGSVIFVMLGLWFVISPPVIRNPIIGNPTTLFIIGLASILFFGTVGFYIFKKLFDNTPGIIISNEGFFDNASGVCVGFVPWTDVIEISEITIANRTFMSVTVKNPQDYIDREKSAFKRKLIQINYRSYGTVIGIQAIGLKCTYVDLKKLIEDRFEEFKRKTI